MRCYLCCAVPHVHMSVGHCLDCLVCICVFLPLTSKPDEHVTIYDYCHTAAVLGNDARLSDPAVSPLVLTDCIERKIPQYDSLFTVTTTASARLYLYVEHL